MTNEEKLKRLKTRKILQIIIIIFALLTIVLSCCSLFINISPIYAILCFIIEVTVTKYREKINLKEEEKPNNKKKSSTK